jgi:hypothetical protein
MAQIGIRILAERRWFFVPAFYGLALIHAIGLVPSDWAACLLVRYGMKIRVERS